MFDNKARQQLHSLLPSLRGWEDSVAAQAKGFHRLRRLLQSDVEVELQRLFPRKAVAENCAQRYRPLAKLAADLDALSRQQRPLDGELDDLQSLFAHERELAAYGEQAGLQWREALRRLPAQCEREADVFQAGQDLAQIAQAIRLHAQTLRAFQEADAMLRRLGADADTAELESELARARQAMAAGRVSLDGARQINKLCVPLAALLNRPEPQELQSLTTVLAEIRHWNRSLDVSPEQERGLAQGYRQLLGTDGWRRDPEASRALLREAEALREALAAQGRALRESQRGDLEALFDELVYALGPQPDIRQRLDALKSGGWDSVHRHEDWLEKFKETDAFFKAITSNEEPALEKRLRERGTELRQQVRQLQDLRLAEGLRRQAQALEQDAEAFCQPQESQALLRALRQGNALARQLAQLDAQARQDLDDEARRQRALRADNQCLQEAAARLGGALEDLAPAIERLSAEVSAHTPDQVRAWAQSLAQQLADQRQVLLQHGQARQQALLAEIGGYRDALRLAGWADEEADSLAEPADLAEFAGHLAALARQRDSLERQIGQAIAELERRRERQQADLAALAQQKLPPGEREEVFALLGSPAPVEASPLQRLGELVEATQAGAAFLARLCAEQAAMQTLLDSLKERLQAFKQARLQAYCPEELLRRVADLAYGIPVPPAASQLAQLQAAQTLFDRLEQQARRRAAQIVDEQLAVLAQRHPRPPDAAALLAEFRTLGDEAAVPLHLRLRLRHAVAAIEAG